MDKHRFRSYLDDGLFVVLIMAAAMASAAMEASAVLGAMPKADATQLAKAARRRIGAGRAAAGGSIVGRRHRPQRRGAARVVLGPALAPAPRSAPSASRAGRRAASD